MMPQNSPQQLGLFSDSSSPAGADALPEAPRFGWMGSIADFLDRSPDQWLEQLSTHYQQLYQQRPAPTQMQAWQDCGEISSEQLAILVQHRSESQDWTLIFEYELPRQGGRRPDLVLLAGGRILVLEFKQKRYPSLSDLDQVAAYERDLTDYHRASQGHPITPILIPTRAHSPIEQERSSLPILSPVELAPYLQQIAVEGPAIDPTDWVNSDYAPLPTVVQAARQLFQHQALPQIRRAESAGIPALLEYLYELVDRAKATGERHLVLITGVPGAGKTLVGLQFVYGQTHAADQIGGQTADGQTQVASQTQVTQTAERKPANCPVLPAAPDAVLLSGNGPLITVLQYALKSKVFVQPVRNFYLQHQIRNQTAPPEHIIVFDEAQRAWDADRMAEKYGVAQSASEVVLRIAERIPDWCVVVSLIGEGQEIHIGEEAGLAQWNHSLSATTIPWQVHCAPAQAEFFPAVPADRLKIHPRFNLTTSLRSHRASQLQAWVSHLLAAELGPAAARMKTLRQQGFAAYLTRDLQRAQQYCRDRYAAQDVAHNAISNGSQDSSNHGLKDAPDQAATQAVTQAAPSARYGLIASSRARNLSRYGIPNDYRATAQLNVGAWYVDPPDSPKSCCAFQRAVTEFGCQGLELDLPILGWGDDLRWQEPEWISTVRQRQAKSPLRLRLNSYRVLLTRGRDGLIVFVPPEAKMDETYEALQRAGLVELP